MWFAVFVASRGVHFPHLYPPRLPLSAVRAVHVLRAAEADAGAAGVARAAFAIPPHAE